VDQTAATARRTADTATSTAISARRAADEASQTLGSSRPLLLRILRDVQGITGVAKGLLHSLLGSEALGGPEGKTPRPDAPGDAPRALPERP
jgi:hypothetical protein